jgi:hypothetical protein
MAEYRRIVYEKFDAQYWLMATPVLITFFCLYKLIVGNKVQEEKERIRAAVPAVPSIPTTWPPVLPPTV